MSPTTKKLSQLKSKFLDRYVQVPLPPLPHMRECRPQADMEGISFPRG